MHSVARCSPHSAHHSHHLLEVSRDLSGLSRELDFFLPRFIRLLSFRPVVPFFLTIKKRNKTCMAFQTHIHAAHCPSWVSCTAAMQHGTVAHTHRNSELLIHYTHKKKAMKSSSQAVFTPHRVSMGWQQQAAEAGLVACFARVPRGSFYHPLSRPPQGAHLCCCHSLRLQSTSRRGPPANKHRTSALQTHTACPSSKHSPRGISFLAGNVQVGNLQLRIRGCQ